jgi:hypothetical protein
MISIVTMPRWLCLPLLPLVLADTSIRASAQEVAARLPKAFTEKCLSKFIRLEPFERLERLEP